MNIPEIYLVEPYNAYAPKQKKKHWHEVIEEQALMARILAEQQALQEAQNSKTLPPTSPSIATPTVGGIPQGGAGGQPPPQFFNPGDDIVDFTFTPTGGAAPLTITFTNLTTTPQFDSYKWIFGDGATSTDVNPVHIYQSGSSPVSYTCSLQTTNSITGAPGVSSIPQYISASIPTVTAAFTFITTSNIAPFSVSFSNGSSTTSQTPSLTYKWTFNYNNGAAIKTTTSVLKSPPDLRVDTGSFTASLQATGSYNIASKATSMFLAPSPTFGVTDTFVSSSNEAPTLVMFSAPTITNTGHGIVSGVWHSGELKEDLTEWVQTPYDLYPAYSNTYSTRSVTGQDRKFTASLQLTESSYGLTALWTASFLLNLPTVTPSFTVAPGAGVAPQLETFSNTTTVVTGSSGDPLIYLWTYGSASLVNTTVGSPPTLTYTVAGNYTASLQVTESLFGIAAKYTQSWKNT